jgi:putative intracellular protease/amidase
LEGTWHLAAICATIAAIVRAGLIRGRRHTSNGLKYLKKQVPNDTDAAMRMRQPFATADSSPQAVWPMWSLRKKSWPN